MLVVVLVLTTAIVWLVGGTYPELALPGFEGVEGRALIYVGLTVAAISFATSPAATPKCVTRPSQVGTPLVSS